MRRFAICAVFFTLACYALSQQPVKKQSIEAQAFIGICACGDTCDCCEGE